MTELILFAAGHTINGQPSTRKLYEPRMNILVTRNLPSSVMARLREVGSVDLYTDGAIPPGVLKLRLADKDALVCPMSDDIDRTVIDAGARLKIIANVAVGYDNID